jgi:hypothetical protein
VAGFDHAPSVTAMVGAGRTLGKRGPASAPSLGFGVGLVTGLGFVCEGLMHPDKEIVATSAANCQSLFPIAKISLGTHDVGNTKNFKKSNVRLSTSENPLIQTEHWLNVKPERDAFPEGFTPSAPQEFTEAQRSRHERTPVFKLTLP